MKFRVICCDPPYSFSDQLKMKDGVKRSAADNYKVMSNQDILNLPVKDLAEDDAILCLWCPSSLLPFGLEIIKSWGFEFKTTAIWVKTKKDTSSYTDPNDMLAFGMGRTLRATHEMALAIRGKIYQHLKNKSQRSVHFAPNFKHSQKPENLQDSLELMFPDSNKIEIFARKERIGWTCVGNEAPNTKGEDISTSIQNLIR